MRALVWRRFPHREAGAEAMTALHTV